MCRSDSRQLIQMRPGVTPDQGVTPARNHTSTEFQSLEPCAGLRDGARDAAADGVDAVECAADSPDSGPMGWSATAHAPALRRADRRKTIQPSAQSGPRSVRQPREWTILGNSLNADRHAGHGHRRFEYVCTRARPPAWRTGASSVRRPSAPPSTVSMKLPSAGLPGFIKLVVKKISWGRLREAVAGGSSGKSYQSRVEAGTRASAQATFYDHPMRNSRAAIRCSSIRRFRRHACDISWSCARRICTLSHARIGRRLVRGCRRQSRQRNRLVAHAGVIRRDSCAWSSA